MKPRAIIYTHDLLTTVHAKTCHALLRESGRFEIEAIVDFGPRPPKDDPFLKGVPIYSSVEECLKQCRSHYVVVGVDPSSGLWPQGFKENLVLFAKGHLSLVNGLHRFLGDDPEIAEVAQQNNIEVIDIRKPKPFEHLRFFTGDIDKILTPCVAVLGTDSSLGKRTTATFLKYEAKKRGFRSEVIFTGYTGWLQGNEHGICLDATLAGYVSGELEGAILTCVREARPDIMFIEGHSSLRNPAGPCGAELLISGNAKKVILQYSPSRTHFNESPSRRIHPIQTEIELIRLYGGEVVAVTLNEENISERDLIEAQRHIHRVTELPCFRPLVDDLGALLDLVLTAVSKDSSCRYSA